MPHASIAAIGPGIGGLICRHIDTAFRRLLHGTGVTAERRFICLITRTGHPFGQFACVSHPVTLDGIAAAIEPMVNLPFPSAVVCAGPVPEPAAKLLVESGYAASGMPAMAVDIEKLPETKLPDGYRFIRCTADQCDAWAEAFAAGYEIPRPVSDAFAVGLAAPAEDAAQFFAVLKGETPVATSVIFLHDGVAGVYAVATVPPERGKGLGAHATAEALRVASRQGYRVGVLQSSHAGHPLYLRLGFADRDQTPLFVRMG